MRSSPWSLGLLLAVMGVSLIYFSRQPATVQPVMPTTYAVSVVLIVTGLLQFLKRPVMYWFALGAGLLTIAVSGVSFLLRKELVPTPIVTALIGLLVTFRVLLAQSFERREAAREAARRLEEGRRQGRAGASPTETPAPTSPDEPSA